MPFGESYVARIHFLTFIITLRPTMKSSVCDALPVHAADSDSYQGGYGFLYIGPGVFIMLLAEGNVGLLSHCQHAC